MFFLKLFITSIFCDKVKSILRKHLSQSIHKLIISRGHKSVILNLKVLDQKYTKKSYFDPFQDFMTNLTCSFARQCSLRILLWSYNSNFTVYGRFCSPLIFSRIENWFLQLVYAVDSTVLLYFFWVQILWVLTKHWKFSSRKVFSDRSPNVHPWTAHGHWPMVLEQ